MLLEKKRETITVFLSYTANTILVTPAQITVLEKNCTAQNQLFYSHYLVVCIRLLLLLVVCTMCSRRNCQTTQLEN